MTQPKKTPNAKELTRGMTRKQKVRFYFDDLTTPQGKAVDFGVIFLIAILCVTYVVSTYDKAIGPTALAFIHYIEMFIVGIFIVEYILRFWVAEHKVKHFFNVYSLIDLISILPFFFTFSNLQFVRIFRVLRLFRILRFLRFLRDERFFFGTVRENELIIARIIFTIFAIIFVSSGLIYYQEHVVFLQERGPKDLKIHSFFDAVYFTIVTLTTVGYGDITPQTQGGKIVTILMILSGVIFLPWQIATLIRKFLHSLNKRDVICTNCGLKYHDRDASHCKSCGYIIYQEFENKF